MELRVNAETSYYTEEQTRHPCHNQLWHDVQKNRLTPSVFKDILSRKSDFEPIAEKLLKPKNITDEMKFGMQNEHFAVETYCQLTGNSSFLCGFVINPCAPHLGTSPDRKVFDENAAPQCGLLEIECPCIEESFTDCPYLKLNATTGVYKLRRSHKYFYQIMGQMALTGMTWCDFFVKCKEDYHLERVYFDKSIWSSMKEGLDKFYFDVFLPNTCRL
jgi:hypothetical protein